MFPYRPYRVGSNVHLSFRITHLPSARDIFPNSIDVYRLEKNSGPPVRFDIALLGDISGAIYRHRYRRSAEITYLLCMWLCTPGCDHGSTPFRGEILFDRIVHE